MDAFLSQEVSIATSSLNWSEILTCLQRVSPTTNGEGLAAMLPGIEIVPFGRQEAERAAELAKSCGSLSLGDRACLSLASSRKTTAWTTDKIWARMDVGANLEMLR